MILITKTIKCKDCKTDFTHEALSHGGMYQKYLCDTCVTDRRKQRDRLYSANWRKSAKNRKRKAKTAMVRRRVNKIMDNHPPQFSSEVHTTAKRLVTTIKQPYSTAHN